MPDIYRGSEVMRGSLKYQAERPKCEEAKVKVRREKKRSAFL